MKQHRFFAKALILMAFLFSSSHSMLIAQEAEVRGVGIDFQVSVDVLGIAKTISSAVSTATNRPGWVKNLMESSFYAAGQKYNVMVFNLNQDYDYKFQGVKFYGSAVYDGITYGIWVFDSGEFWNRGDGGYINWAFNGWYQRNDSYVKFRRP